MSEDITLFFGDEHKALPESNMYLKMWRSQLEAVEDHERRLRAQEQKLFHLTSAVQQLQKQNATLSLPVKKRPTYVDPEVLEKIVVTINELRRLLLLVQKEEQVEK